MRIFNLGATRPFQRILTHLRSLCSGRLLCGSVLHELDTEHEAAAAHIPNDVMLLLQPPHTLQQQVAHLPHEHIPMGKWQVKNLPLEESQTSRFIT
jgi:hypothetical protein